MVNASTDDDDPSTDFGPENASTALTEDVHPCDVEVLRGVKHVAVVGIDLLEAMLLGAGQVQRVAGSEEDCARNVEDRLAGLFQ